MKFYTSLPKALKPYFEAELLNYKNEKMSKNYISAWYHLERAHILGQKYPVSHTLVHWEMLQFGFKIKNIKEIIGQIPRLIFGGVKSFIGKIPVGNPGGANVPPLKSYPIEASLQHILNKTGVA